MDRDKFDFQLSVAVEREAELKRILETAKIEKWECKDETYQWRRTGNICVEYECRGKASGITDTDADFWAHTLHNDDGTVLVHLLFPVEMLKQLGRGYAKQGFKRRGGDDGQSRMVNLPLHQIALWEMFQRWV